MWQQDGRKNQKPDNHEGQEEHEEGKLFP